MQKHNPAFHMSRQDMPTMYFIGVTTGQSTMTRLFPFWVQILGLSARLIGVDLPAELCIGIQGIKEILCCLQQMDLVCGD